MYSGPISRLLCCAVLLHLAQRSPLAQNTESKPAPVIDVHVHAMDANSPASLPCAQHLEIYGSDPKLRKTLPVG